MQTNKNKRACHRHTKKSMINYAVTVEVKQTPLFLDKTVAIFFVLVSRILKTVSKCGSGGAGWGGRGGVGLITSHCTCTLIQCYAVWSSLTLSQLLRAMHGCENPCHLVLLSRRLPNVFSFNKSNAFKCIVCQFLAIKMSRNRACKQRALKTGFSGCKNELGFLLETGVTKTCINSPPTGMKRMWNTNHVHKLGKNFQQVSCNTVFKTQIGTK